MSLNESDLIAPSAGDPNREVRVVRTILEAASGDSDADVRAAVRSAMASS